MNKSLVQAMGKRAIDIVSLVPVERHGEVSVIAFVVHAAATDPRHQVVEIAVDVGDESDRSWRPSTFAFPSLGGFGDPTSDRLVADEWAALNEQYNIDRWSLAAGEAPAFVDAAGRLTPLTTVRELYLAMLPDCARFVRQRLRRRAGWRDRWTMFVVTDATWDQAYSVSQAVNDGPLPFGLTDYLGHRYEGAEDL